MKRNQYIFLGMVFIAIPSLVQAQTQPKDTTLNRTVVVEQEGECSAESRRARS